MWHYNKLIITYYALNLSTKRFTASEVLLSKGQRYM